MPVAAQFTSVNAIAKSNACTPNGSPPSTPLKLNYTFNSTTPTNNLTPPLISIPLKWKSFLSLNSVLPSTPPSTRSNTSILPPSSSISSIRSNLPPNTSSRQRRPSFFGFSKSQLSNSSTFLHSRFHSIPNAAPLTRLRSTSEDVVLATSSSINNPISLRGRASSPVKETFHINHQYATESPIFIPRTLFPTTALEFPSPVHVSSSVSSTSENKMSQTPSPTGSPQPVLLINQYLILDEIGSGSFGNVVKVFNTDDQAFYACKIISKSRLKRKFRFRSDSLQQCEMRREIAIFKKLSCGHPNITTLLEVLDAQDQDNLYLVFELCCKPIMKFNMGEQVVPYSEEIALKYFRHVVLGLDYLHSKRVIHCDLKPENILITWDDRAQISDFGIAHMCEEDSSNDHIPNRTGSPAFTAPECCQSHLDTVPGRTLDIWCLGVTLYCLTHGRVPFYSDSVLDLYTSIVNGEPVYSPTLSTALHALLVRMLAKYPELRISLPEIMAHDWVTTSASFPLYPYDLFSATAGDLGQDVSVVTEDDMKSALSEVGLLSKLWTKFRSKRKLSSLVASPSPSSMVKDVSVETPVLTGTLLGSLSIQDDTRKVSDERKIEGLATVDSVYTVSPIQSFGRK